MMQVKLGKKTLKEATNIIQELVVDQNSDTGMDSGEVETVIKYAKAGAPGYDEEVVKIVKYMMDNYNLDVEGMERDEAAREIYRYLWGLDVLEELYKSPEVDDIRINNPKKVYYQERGKNLESNIKLRDNYHLNKIIHRLIEHDRASLDESNPGCESRRLDGSRITALTAPIVKSPNLVIRKHGNFEITDENYINSGTMNRYIMDMLSTFVQGRANILISGDTSSGKTTLARWLFKFMKEKLRVITLETDRELLLDEWYPSRDIVSMEAHPEIGWGMKECFATTKRLSPSVIIVGEARGIGEAGQMIDACQSGHHGTMGTIHCVSAREAVPVLAQMAMEEGRKLPVEILEDKIARYFDIIIQMYGNEETGTRRIENIVEVKSKNSAPKFRDLVVWSPSQEDYEIGDWEYPEAISEDLTKKLFKFGVSNKKLKDLERRRDDAA